MRGIASVALLGGALVAAPLATELPAGAAAPLSIAACVLAAGVACEGFAALTVASGALAALGYHALADASPALGGAALVALALATRSLRGRTPRWRAAHLAASAAAGAAAAWVAWRYGGDASPAVRAAAVVVAGLVASVTLAFPADDPVGHALGALAREVPGAAGDRLLRASLLRRRALDAPATEALPAATAARVEMAWRALADIAAQRAAVAASQGATPVLDRRIEQHVDALERIHAAADERFARAAGLGDPRLAAAKIDGEALETEVRALMEVGSA